MKCELFGLLCKDEDGHSVCMHLDQIWVKNPGEQGKFKYHGCDLGQTISPEKCKPKREEK